MAVGTIWREKPRTVERNLLCFLAHPSPSYPTPEKPLYLFFKAGGALEPELSDSCFNFSFRPALKLRRVALIPTSDSTSCFQFEAKVKNVDRGEGIHSARSSPTSLGRAESWKSWGFSAFPGATSRGAEPPLKLLLQPLGSPSCPPPVFDQLLGMSAVPQGL